MAKENLFVRHSFLAALEPLSDAEVGRLFKAMLRYSVSDIDEELDGNERFIWPVAKEMIDSDNKRYREIVESRREAGSKGGKQKVANVANATFAKQIKPTTTTTSTTTTTTTETKETIPRASAFDAFWKAYPKKSGKGAAEKAFSKLPASLLPKLLDAIELQKQSIQWQKENGQFIPNPATWLNQRRWEDELPKASGSGFAYDAGGYEEGTSL